MTAPQVLTARCADLITVDGLPSAREEDQLTKNVMLYAR